MHVWFIGLNRETNSEFNFLDKQDIPISTDKLVIFQWWVGKFLPSQECRRDHGVRSWSVYWACWQYYWDIYININIYATYIVSMSRQGLETWKQCKSTRTFVAWSIEIDKIKLQTSYYILFLMDFFFLPSWFRIEVPNLS